MSTVLPFLATLAATVLVILVVMSDAQHRRITRLEETLRQHGIYHD